MGGGEEGDLREEVGSWSHISAGGLEKIGTVGSGEREVGIGEDGEGRGRTGGSS